MLTDRTGDGLRGLTTRLLVLFLAMVVAGFVIPSPGVSAPRPKAENQSNASKVEPSRYHPMKKSAPPKELVVRSLGLRAPIVPIVLETSVLEPPSDPSIVGWWTGSAEPGSKRGQTVLTGHTVHTGGGVMDRLGTIRPGALVQVVTSEGTMNYEATRVVVYTRAQLAENATALFRQNRPNPRLVLITCTGWTGSDYTSNVIVFGKPLGLRNKPRRLTSND